MDLSKRKKDLWRDNFDSFFYKTIECDLGVYGYKDGDFFDEGYDNPDKYEEAIKRLSCYKK